MEGLYAAVAACAVAAKKSGQSELRGTFMFPQDFIGFAGHFPDLPVLPGIVQMMAVLHTCAACDLPVRMTGIQSCKFIQSVFPGQEMRVAVTLPDAGREEILRAFTSVGESVCAEMTLLVASVPAGTGP
jgi:3-hydroxyacyl-[acyl-carrier-protein] dehydratase